MASETAAVGDVPVVGVGPEPGDPAFEPDPALLDPADTHEGVEAGHAVLVDPGNPGFEPAGDCEGAFCVRRPYRGAEPVLRGVGPLDGLFDVGNGEDRHDGA